MRDCDQKTMLINFDGLVDSICNENMAKRKSVRLCHENIFSS